MAEDRSSYRQIFKATSIFGGVQVFNIMIGIIRSKAAALFLGTEGMGIVGLFNSTLDMIRSVTSLGINISAVRDISEAKAKNDELEVNAIITTTRKLCLFTGFGGMIMILVLASKLSEWTFGNNNYTVSFLVLSVVPLITSLTMGQLAVLQGLHKIKFLAKANLLGGAVGLLFLIPFYWIWRMQAIVPYIIISALLSFLFSSIYVRKLTIRNVKQVLCETLINGRRIIILGIMLTLSTFVVALSAYILRIFISNVGSISDVGLYNAAFALVDTYTGLVFTAMSTDFYPRLSSVNHDNRQMMRLINHQAEIGVLILAPMIIVFMILAPFLLTLLYSSKFIPITTMLQWAMLAILLKTVSWPLAFSLLVKAENKKYLLKELASSIYFLGFSVIGYNYWGLTGLGVGFLLAYICNLIQILIINKVFYKITLGISFLKIFIPHFVCCIIVFLSLQFVKNQIVMYYAVGIPALVISAIISYSGLEKCIGIRSIIQNRIKRRDI
jgi:PST family polysaccharide transporter